MRQFLFVLLCALAFPALGQTYVTPEEARKDPDFELQGEYVDTTRGLQVIALGDGEFQVVTYTDGLPGAGWNGKEKKSIEVDADALESLLRNFKRVERKSPSLGAKPPAGAVVLFDGTPESLKQHWKPGAKITTDGLLQQGCTSIDTFGDYSLHLEFRTPFKPTARGQGRGNSGLYHQGRFETQILDSFGLEGQMNETGGIYSIRKPDLNMCLPPLTWQTYDVDFVAARFDGTGKKTANAKMTVKLNGVVIHRDVELPKATTAAPVRDGAEDGPIYLQDHGNPVRFRNIWVMPRDMEAEARRPIVPAFERFHVNAGDPVSGGQLLLGELNCVACHKADDSFVKMVGAKQAPVLTDIGSRAKPEWLVDYIANPHVVKAGTTMPDVMAGKTIAERRAAAVAITNYLVAGQSLNSGGKGANSGVGETLFHQAGCVACHLPRNDQKANAATSIPLGELGDKYTRASLEAFLKDPLKVRPSGRMPKIDVGGDNWRHIAQYLTGDTGVQFGTRRDLPKKPNMKFMAYYKGVDKFPNLDEMKPDKTGVSRGLDISVGERNENVIISFRGFLPIKAAGKYSFRLGSDDGSRLYLDGKQIINNDGVHPMDYREGSVQLTTGLHEIRVDYFEKGGEESLLLLWAGPGIKSAAIDKAIVMSRDGQPVTPVAPAKKADPNEFVFDASQVDSGRTLFQSLGCASCHTKLEKGKRVESSLSAPMLTSIKELSSGCLGEAGNGSPNYDLSVVQVSAITKALKAGQPWGGLSKALQLQHKLKSLNCYACHKRGEFGGSETDRNKFFVSTIPEMGDEGRLPPPLNGVGDKLRQDWMRQVVSAGNKSRPYMKTYMPGFGNAHGGELAELFAGLDERTEAKIVKSDEPETRVVAIGRKMVGAKGLACVSCHTFGKFKSSGIQAIALDTMAKRIREDWFHRYLPNPQEYRPGTRMPTGYPDGKSTVKDIYNGDQALQLTAMWAFLSKGSSGGVPEGIMSGSLELKPTEKPIIYRNFIEGVTPRGIAVGYPEKANICWDANQLSLALIWQDRFIDASKHWEGRGPGNQVPLGGGVVNLEKVTPVAALKDLSEAWPTASPRERGYKFLGYRLDKNGRPTFRYRVANLVIEDKPIPVEGDVVSTLARQLAIKVEGDLKEDYYFRAASGNAIKKDGEKFVVDGKLTIQVNQDARVRTVAGKQELLVPIAGEVTITQDIVW